jgi:hypothetical protein
MVPDPNEEILAIKRRLAAKLDNDLHRIAADVRQRQGLSGHEVISLPPRRCAPTEEQRADRERGSERKLS